MAFFYFKILIQEVEEMPEEPSKNIEHRKITYNINIFDGKMEGFLPSYCDEINLTGIIV